MTADAPAGAGHSAGRLTGRLALVTGASRGIGRAVALRYAAEGAHVIALAKTQAGLEELDDAISAAGGKTTLVVADLTDFDALDRLGASIFERWGRLDVLVGNAAVLGTLTPVGHIDPKTWDEVIAVNLTANWRLIRSLDPLLRISDAGRALFVTSGVASGRAYWGTYAVSKGALETLVRTYAAEIGKTSVRANLIDPGATRTRMRAAAYPGEKPENVKPPEAVTDVFVALAEPGCSANGEIVHA